MVYKYSSIGEQTGTRYSYGACGNRCLSQTNRPQKPATMLAGYQGGGDLKATAMSSRNTRGTPRTAVRSDGLTSDAAANGGAGRLARALERGRVAPRAPAQPPRRSLGRRGARERLVQPDGSEGDIEPNGKAAEKPPHGSARRRSEQPERKRRTGGSGLRFRVGKVKTTLRSAGQARNQRWLA